MPDLDVIFPEGPDNHDYNRLNSEEDKEDNEKEED